MVVQNHPSKIMMNCRCGPGQENPYVLTSALRTTSYKQNLGSTVFVVVNYFMLQYSFIKVLLKTLCESTFCADYVRLWEVPDQHSETNRSRSEILLEPNTNVGLRNSCTNDALCCSQQTKTLNAWKSGNDGDYWYTTAELSTLDDIFPHKQDVAVCTNNRKYFE